jgi:hypothetical protein
MQMKKLISLAAFALTIVALPALAQNSKRAGSLGFASDFQTIPVVANLTGIGGKFVTYVSIYNPTASAYTIQASLFDASGTRHDAVISVAAGELKTYANFVDTIFNGFIGGGAVTLRSADSAGGQRNNRFIVEAEVRTQGGHYGTSVPVLEFAGTGSRSFASGINVDSNSRTNIGCFDESGFANKVHVTILDSTGTQTVGSTDLNLAANGWFQTAVTSIVSNGIVRFEPSDAAVCYAVVVDNTTQDGRVLSASEYQP